MKKNEFFRGLKDGFPICLGYFSVSFAFGIFTVANGLTSVEALLISMTNVTSAGQLASVPIIAGGGTFIELAVSQLVINLRYALMSVSLSQKFDETVKLRHRFLFAFMNTDEVFGVAMSNYRNVGKVYMAGLILTPYLGWSAGTIIGAVAGDVLPSVVTTSLGVAIYGMFVAIVLPVAKKGKNTAVCVVFAIVLSCLFRYVPALKSVPSGFVIIICAVTASAVMAVAAPLKTTGETEEDAT